MIISPGSAVGAYSLTTCLHISADSSVWTATDARSAECVVLKIVRCARTEFTVHRRLAHTPEVVRLLEEIKGVEAVVAGKNAQVDIAALEFVRGGDLMQRICGGEWCREDQVVRPLFISLVHAVSSCHQAGVSHLDICPSNVLLDSSGSAVLLDFSDSVSGSSASHLSGSDGFRPPEVMEGRQYDTRPVDVFSLGITLFAMKTARLPFPRLSVTPCLKVLGTCPERYWKSVPGVSARFSPQLKDLFALMVSLDPSARLSTEEVLAHPWVTGA